MKGLQRVQGKSKKISPYLSTGYKRKPDISLNLLVKIRTHSYYPDMKRKSVDQERSPEQVVESRQLIRRKVSSSTSAMARAAKAKTITRTLNDAYNPKTHPMLVVLLGEQGKTFSEIAKDINISAQQMRAWVRQHPDFKEAIMEARSRCKAWWIQRGVANLGNSFFNTGLYCFMMANLFGWRRTDATQKIEMSGGTRTDHHFHLDLTKVANDDLDKLESARRVVAAVAGTNRGRALLPQPR